MKPIKPVKPWKRRRKGHMRSDMPTPSHLGTDEPDAATDAVAFHEAPPWPPAGERHADPYAPDGLSKRHMSATLFKVSLGVNGVVLLGLLSYFLLSQTGVFASGGSGGP